MILMYMYLRLFVIVDYVSFYWTVLSSIIVCRLDWYGDSKKETMESAMSSDSLELKSL